MAVLLVLLRQVALALLVQVAEPVPALPRQVVAVADVDKVPQAGLQQVDLRQVDLPQQQGLKAAVAAPCQRCRVHRQPAVAVVVNAVEDL